jgi:hypothetical protein
MVWAADLAMAARRELAWLWHGYLAPGNVTLLTSRWKSGKTTLLSILLARRVPGGVLADRPLAAGRSAVVSEESHEHWEARRRRLGFGNHAGFLCRPFPGKPSAAQWQALIDRLALSGARDGVDLTVTDSLSWFLPGRTENQAALMLEALAPLHHLTQSGMAVLLLHHPRKGEVPEGEAARGSGALSSFADILIEMGYRGSADRDGRRRVLRGFSRYDETPRELVIELNAEGTDYAAVGDVLEGEFKDNWARLKAALVGAPKKLTRREIVGRWIDDGSPPAETSLRRWLHEAITRGLLRCEGEGTPESPLRYWLPEAEQRWKDDPLYELFEADRRVREDLARRVPGERLA